MQLTQRTSADEMSPGLNGQELGVTSSQRIGNQAKGGYLYVMMLRNSSGSASYRCYHYDDGYS